MKIKNNINAFTLIEIMVGILIVSIVMIGGFKALSAITLGKVKIIQKTEIQKESLYFTEKLFEMIKKGGTLDYEEYFNRKVIGNTTYSSGHFDIESGFGNFGSGGTVLSNTFGDGFYYCRSGNGVSEKMTGSGCYDNNLNIYTESVLGKQQRYGQYSFQFIDYNSNFNIDLGDENGNGNIIGDDDDEYLGDGPAGFESGISSPELYLISGNKKERTLFRWNVKFDPNAPSGSSCSINNSTNILTGSGCIGNIEYLKLDGKDFGKNHDKSGNMYLDGVIDTWIINNQMSLSNDRVAGIGNIDWIPLFSETINVSEFKVFGYPNKDRNNAWKNNDKSVNVSPYIVLNIKLKPSWKSRKSIKSEGEELDFSMTINLSDIYSN